VEHVRQHSVASGVLVLLGSWLLVDTLSRSSLPGGSLYPLRNAFQGLLFALTGVSNLLAVRAYPEQKTTLTSLCCGAAAAASGFV
jgi:hypothetical protein